MAHNHRYESVVNILAQRVFTGKLAPGEKLPTERSLALSMEIDRTSLRLALKQLESLGVLDIRPGDGIYVKDFLKEAGPEFLRLIFAQEEDDQGRPFAVDPYTVDEIWEFWCGFFPMMLKSAIRKIAPRDVKKLLDLVDEEKGSIGDVARLVDLNMREEDLVAAATNNIVFMLLSNVTRTIRKKMLTLFFSGTTSEVLTRHVELKRVFLEEFLTSPEKMLPLAAFYEDVLLAHLSEMRKKRSAGNGAGTLAERYGTSLMEKSR